MLDCSEDVDDDADEYERVFKLAGVAVGFGDAEADVKRNSLEKQLLVINIRNLNRMDLTGKTVKIQGQSQPVQKPL